MVTLESAAPIAARPPAWYRASRIAISLMPLISVHIALFAMFEVEITLVSVIMFFVMTRISGMGITIGFHRYFSHHSFKTSRWFQFLMGVAG